MGFKVQITGPSGEFSAHYEQAIVTIGREEENDLVLDGSAVSKRHAKVEWRGARLFLEDLASTNGTWRLGERIVGEVELAPEDDLELEIGPFQLALRWTSGDGAAALREEPALPKGEGALSHPSGPRLTGALEGELRRFIHEEVIEAMDLRRLDIGKLGDTEIRQRTEEAIDRILSRLLGEGRLPEGLSRERLKKELADEALGLGPLEELLADDEVSEVMVNGPSRIYVEKEGKLALSPLTFSSEQAVLSIIERIAAQVGRRIDEASPMVDARWRDGSRVSAIIPPLSLIGPCITIRKFRRERLTIEELVQMGAMDWRMRRFLEIAVRARKNILISGGTGSGKTTLLNLLTEMIAHDERIITVEDAAELQIRQPHWIPLEARPPNMEGKGAITIRELVRGCLRMRPDRIVVGECRGGEALDMLQAMNTGHDGSLTTLHANTPRDAIARLETLCLMAGTDLPMRAVREQIASAVDLILQQSRFADGSRRITSISEVVGMEGERVVLQEIFTFDRGHRSLGFVPTFCERMIEGGEEVDVSIFREEAA